MYDAHIWGGRTWSTPASPPDPIITLLVAGVSADAADAHVKSTASWLAPSTVTSNLAGSLVRSESSPLVGRVVLADQTTIQSRNGGFKFDLGLQLLLKIWEPSRRCSNDERLSSLYCLQFLESTPGALMALMLCTTDYRSKPGGTVSTEQNNE